MYKTILAILKLGDWLSFAVEVTLGIFKYSSLSK